MRRKGLWISVLATALIAGSASAAPGTFMTEYVSFPGSFLTNSLNQNWGVNPSVLTTVTSVPGTWASNQGTYLEGDGVTSPGFGDQDFDIEAMYSGFDVTKNTLYFTLVTGFNWYGEAASGGPYAVGDYFVDFNDDNDWDLAFDLSTPASNAGPIASDPLTFQGTLDAYSGNPVGGSNPPQGYPTSDPYRITSGTQEVGAVGFSYFRGTNPTLPNTDPSYHLDHNVYNFSYVLDPLNNATHAGWLQNLYAGTGGSGYGVHWTMSCGNDLLDMEVDPFDGSPRDNVVPVPAAAPLGLLGMGLLALVRRVRRRPEC